MKIPEHRVLIKAWRERVMDKTKWSCAHCGGKATDAHHIMTKGSSTWKMEYDIQNGIPLCHEHHQQIHTRGNCSFKLSIEKHLMIHHGITIEELKARSRMVNKKTQFAIDELVEELI